MESRNINEKCKLKQHATNKVKLLKSIIVLYHSALYWFLIKINWKHQGKDGCTNKDKLETGY